MKTCVILHVCMAMADISSWSFSSYQLSLALEDNLPRAASNPLSMSSSKFLHPPEIKGTSACAWVFWEANIWSTQGLCSNRVSEDSKGYHLSPCQLETPRFGINQKEVLALNTVTNGQGQKRVLIIAWGSWVSYLYSTTGNTKFHVKASVHG